MADGFCKPSPVGEGVSHRLTDEVSITLIYLSRQRTYHIHARPSFICGRADNACTNLLDYLVRYVRTRGMTEAMGSSKLLTFAMSFAARTRHAWLARLTRARGVSLQREGNALFDDFWYFWSYKSTIKSHFNSLLKNQLSTTYKIKIKSLPLAQGAFRGD